MTATSWVRLWVQSVFEIIRWMGPEGERITLAAATSRYSISQQVAAQYMFRLARDPISRNRILEHAATRLDTMEPDAQVALVAAARDLQGFSSSFLEAVRRCALAAQEERAATDLLVFMDAVLNQDPDFVLQRRALLARLIDAALHVVATRQEWWEPLNAIGHAMTEELRAVIDGWNASLVLAKAGDQKQLVEEVQRMVLKTSRGQAHEYFESSLHSDMLIVI
jgi:hypothetical protein